MVCAAARPAQPMKTSREIGLSFILVKDAQAQSPLHLAQERALSSSSKREVYSFEEFDREKRNEVRLAQTSDYLSGSRVAGDSDLFPGSGAAQTKWWQLDQLGFSRPSLLDLRHVGRDSHTREFDRSPVISQGWSIAESPRLDGDF